MFFPIFSRLKFRIFHSNIFFACVIFILAPTFSFAIDKPPVQLANVYDEQVVVTDYLISEKYDGVRAIWRDGVLQTRNGYPISAPKWFTRALPNVWLDGELWSQRQNFEFIASVVSKSVPVDDEWRNLTYMVFDAPDRFNRFGKRVSIYTQLIEELNVPFVKAVTQFRVADHAQLSDSLDEHRRSGAEGLMLHRADAVFADGRTDNLLKLKPYMDAEAIVLAHLPGKGKYTGMLGAIRVQLINASLHNDDLSGSVIFKIGSGFSDADRANPPALGSIITFKYHGLSKNNIPRFASYLRVRDSP